LSRLSFFSSFNITRRAALAGALAAAAFATVPVGVSHAQAPIQPDVEVEKLMDGGPLPDLVMGQEDAPYTVIEYSSLTCPACARFHKEVLPELKRKYIDTGKAKYIVREFPLDNVAAAAAMLARCVDNSKYFEFLDLLYLNQEEWAFGSNPLPGLQKFARQAGFTEQRFNECLSNEALLKDIQATRDKANTEFGVRATPTIFINGKKLDNSGIEAIDQVIDGAESKS